MAEVKLEDLKPNSNKYKSEFLKSDEKREKKEAVVTSKTSIKKPSLGEKFVNTFFKEHISDVGDSIVNDVLIPATKEAIYNGITTGIDMLLFGEKRYHNIGRKGGTSYVQYSSISGGGYRRNDTRPSIYDERNRNNISDISRVVFTSRSDAETVLSQMVNTIEEYGFVSLADALEFAGQDSVYTDRKYGWTDVSNAEVRRDREGYIVVLSRPSEIKD